MKRQNAWGSWQDTLGLMVGIVCVFIFVFVPVSWFVPEFRVTEYGIFEYVAWVVVLIRAFFMLIYEAHMAEFHQPPPTAQ